MAVLKSFNDVIVLILSGSEFHIDGFMIELKR